MTLPDNLSAWVYGAEKFGPDEEHLEFQYRLTLWLILSASAVTWAMLVWLHWDVRPAAPALAPAMWVFSVLTLVGWWQLRRNRRNFGWVAWCFLGGALAQNMAMWFWAVGDQLRVLWFIVNVPAVYVVLGQRVGAAVTALSIALLLLFNPINPLPYSPTALTTLVSVLIYLAAFFHNFTDRSLSYYVRMRESNQKLQELATQDSLTGLLNLREFNRQAESLLRVSGRHERNSSLLFIDLDHFKRINDEHGHAAGDAVLRAVAQTLQTRLRQGDLLGRVGGEEFAAFLPETDLEGASHVAETLRQGVSQLDVGASAGADLQITASIGVSSRQGSERSMVTLMRAADEAMYRAKALGRDRVVLAPMGSEGVSTIGQ